MTRVNVKVETGSERFELEDGYIPKFFLESKAKKGRANKELINRVEQITGEGAAIVSGHRSSRKKLEIPMSEKEFKQKIEDYNG